MELTLHLRGWPDEEVDALWNDLGDFRESQAIECVDFSDIASHMRLRIVCRTASAAVYLKLRYYLPQDGME